VDQDAKVENPSRRNFLKSSAIAAAGTASLWAASRFGGGRRTDTAVGSGLKVEPIAPTEASTFGDHYINTAFPGLDGKEKQAARENIKLARANVKGILDNDSYESLRAYESSVKLAARSAGMPSDVGELFLGLIATESGGRSDALSEDGAAGLTQMGEDVAKRQNLKLEDRFIPAKVLPASAKDIAEQNKLRYDSWPMAIWAWHTGPGGMYTILNEYLHDEFGDPKHAIEGATYQQGLEVIDYFKSKIRQRNVNVHRVLKNPAVAKLLADKDNWDYTDEYVYRAVAGAGLYADYKSLRSQTGNG